METQPNMVWRRAFAIVSMFHFWIYTFSRPVDEIHPWVIGFDGIVIAYWAIGGAALIEGISAWRKK